MSNVVNERDISAVKKVICTGLNLSLPGLNKSVMDVRFRRASWMSVMFSPVSFAMS